MKIPSTITRTVARQGLKLQASSPRLLFGAGVVGVVATAVLTARSTLKLDRMLDDIEKEHLQLKELGHDRKDMAFFYARTAKEIAVLYAAPVAVGVVSIGCLTKSHSILTKRNAAVTAAYAAVAEGFAEYRGRVKAELGEEKDREFRFGTTEVKETILDKDGNKQTVTRKILNTAGHSMYARFFGEDNQNWNRKPEYNLLFLRAQQNYANDRLQARGHVFLNEIYDSLGMDHTKAGAVVGWVRGEGDDFIDFGVFSNSDKTKFYDFVTGYEGIWLDFNVDGVIYDKI